MSSSCSVNADANATRLVLVSCPANIASECRQPDAGARPDWRRQLQLLALSHLQPEPSPADTDIGMATTATCEPAVVDAVAVHEEVAGAKRQQHDVD